MTISPWSSSGYVPEGYDSAPTYTNDQIKSAWDATQQQGFSWNDFLSGAQSKYGITADQIAAAGLSDPATTPNWMTQLNSQDAGGSGYDTRTYTDPNTNQQYSAVNNGLNQYVSADANYNKDNIGTTYDSTGKATDTWKVASNSDFDMEDLKGLLAVAGVAAGGLGLQSIYGGAYGAGGEALASSGAAAGGGSTLGAANGSWDILPEAVNPSLSTAASSAAGGNFIPGMDSQLANETLGLSPVTDLPLSPGVPYGLDGYPAPTGNPTGTNVIPSGTPPVPGGTPPTGTTPKVVPSTGGGGGGGSSGGLNLSDLLKLLGGGLDYKNQNDASDKMLEWLKSRTAITDNLYQPGTPEYNKLWDEMSRKDAAAGRNSQYGPRSVDLASRIAQIKSAENTKMTTGIGQWMNGAYQQKASSLGGLLSALGNVTGGSGSTGSLIDLISKYLKSSPDASIPDLSQGQPDLNGDYGNYSFE